MPELSGRRLKGRQLFLALDPAEVFSHHACGRGKRGRVRFTTSAAMAMADRHVQLIDFIFDGAA
jgi:hypothetical protein